MSEERSWGADTVALGRRREGEGAEPPPRRRAPRGPRRGPSPPLARVLAVLGLVVVAVVALVVTLGRGSGAPTTPPAARDLAPRIVVRPPTLPRRGETRRRSKPDLKRRPNGQIDKDQREPRQGSAQPHEQAAPVLEAASAVETAPEAAPVEMIEPESSPAPTPPAVEFGM